MRFRALAAQILATPAVRDALTAYDRGQWHDPALRDLALSAQAILENTAP